MISFFDLKREEQEKLLISKIEDFCKEYDTYNIKAVNYIKSNSNYILSEFYTYNEYQKKIVLYDLVANPIGILVYSLYNEKICLDFFYVKRDVQKKGIGSNLLKILKKEIIAKYGKLLPIYVTPIVFDVPIDDDFYNNIEKSQKRLEEFYRKNNIIIVDDASEYVFLSK